jgi:hypothetical protein
MKALRSIAIGMVALSVASACSSWLPRVSPMQPVPAGNQSGTTDPQTEQSNDLDRSQADADLALRRRGYKPAIYRGERVYCRNETLTGSNLESKVCLTAKQIEDQERAGKDILNGNRPAGCLPKTDCN